MEIEIEDRYSQDMSYTFMTPHGISDKDFNEIICYNFLRLEAVQCPVSRNLLIHDFTELTMEPENDWVPFSKERALRLQNIKIFGPLLDSSMWEIYL